jgi:hypothetical protein
VTLPAGRALKTATFVLGADNNFELSINGEFAGRGNNPTLPMVLLCKPSPPAVCPQPCTAAIGNELSQQAWTIAGS